MIRQVLFPPMLCAAAASGNMDNLVNLHQQVRGCQCWPREPPQVAPLKPRHKTIGVAVIAVRNMAESLSWPFECVSV